MDDIEGTIRPKERIVGGSVQSFEQRVNDQESFLRRRGLFMELTKCEDIKMEQELAQENLGWCEVPPRRGLGSVESIVA